MLAGLLAGMTWGIDTVILGVALAASQFVSTEQAIFLAPFVSTFLHDACSSLWMVLYMGVKKQIKKVIEALKTSSGRWVVVAALLGGPIGMSGYVAAINYIGPAYTAIISSFFPALGAFMSWIFLKDKLKWYQWIALCISIAGIIALSYTPGGASEIQNFALGFIGALICCFGWASETVILDYGLRDPNITEEQALMIRQFTSAITYAVVILTFIKGWGFTLSLIPSNPLLIIAISAFAGTASYIFYYRAIAQIGAAKSMALNITYTVWALIFSLFLLGDIPSVFSICCGVVIVVASLLTATDVKELFNRNKSK